MRDLSFQTMRAALALGIAAAAVPLCAQPAAEQDYSLPAQDLSRSLREVSVRSGQNIIVPSDLVAGRPAPQLEGRFSAREAVRVLLSNTGLEVRVVGEALVIVPAGAGARQDPDDEAIVVTGSHVRGAQPTSPVITLSREEIDRSGATSVEQLMRQVPQNFSGGVNQENFAVPGAGADITEHGAGVNLRGLGQRATLVLVNGRRLAPSGVGSFVDVSLLPLTAVERVEILTDGASAIYGSDAVGGVVNFILRDRFEGLETSLQAGTATEGDGDQLVAGIASGHGWRSGRAMLAYEYRREDEILAGDRDFTINLNPGRFLFPRERRHSLFGAFGQRLAEGLRLDLTGSHAERDTARSFFFTGTAIPVNAVAEARSSGVTASLAYELGRSWLAEASAAWFVSRTEQRQDQPGGQGLVNILDTRNAILEFGVKVDGELVHLPGGPVRLALGAQIRREDYRDLFETQVNVPAVRADRRTVRSLFAEIHLPLVSAANRHPGLERLILTAAARYEDYNRLGGSLDPKLGLLWSPLRGLALRASYGTSFRAPLLSETTGFYNAFFFPAALVFIDPAEAPAGASLALVGSNPGIEPETSRSWTVGAEIEPAFAPGLSLTLNHYAIRFSNRIALPTPQVVVVGDPALEPIVTRDPTLQTVTDILAGAAQILDFSGPGFTSGNAMPEDVRVIVDARFNNTAETRTSGIDIGLHYAFSIGASRLTADLNASHILSFEDRLTRTSPAVETLDTPYRPTDWRFRGGLAWSGGGWSASLFANHVGAYRDNRGPIVRRVGSFTTLDLGIAHDFGAERGPDWLRGTRIAAHVQNLLDTDPPRLLPDPGLSSGLGYDPVNATGRGRVVSVSVRRAW